jgi:4,5-DOPA dioxygenase extradiol
MAQTPLLFVSHGAPTFAINGGSLGQELGVIGQSFTNIKAILAISPHWQTKDLTLTTGTHLSTIHDFYGFGEELNTIKYPAHGDPAIALAIKNLLVEHGYSVEENSDRGLDHGVWTVLVHLLPKANIPIIQLSMPTNLTSRSAYELGRILSSLRQNNILILASGGITHNLYELKPANSPAPSYVLEFTDWIRKAIAHEDHETLIRYRELAPHAERAHPTDEHLLPLMIAYGARNVSEKLKIIKGEATYGVIHTESYAWGI